MAMRATLKGLPAARRAFVEGFEDGVAADGVESGHVESAAHRRRVRQRYGAGLCGAAVLVERSQAGESGDGRSEVWPSSGSRPRSVAAVPGPTPWKAQSLAALAAISGVAWSRVARGREDFGDAFPAG